MITMMFTLALALWLMAALVYWAFVYGATRL